ncbi:MAG: carboxypeptidase regulatory-like domain-containing protein [Leptospiraceae bacterium]|nr:carboxypeptidase regulatory-like domain-containing protein [Leptospiraceae bacterium]
MTLKPLQFIAGILLIFFIASSCTKKKKKVFLPILALGVAASANQQSFGVVTGRLIGMDSNPISDVQVSLDAKGRVNTAITGSDGTFTLQIPGVSRSEGFTAGFTKEGYAGTSRSVFFELANLRVDLGDITLYTSSEASTIELAKGGTEYKITGRVYDGYDNTPLSAVSISITVSGSSPVTALSDSNGYFSLQSSKLSLGSSYTISVSKTNYISDSSTSVSITSTSNTAGDIILTRSYGSISLSLLDDHTGFSLSGASVSSVDSKNATVNAVESSGVYTMSSNYFLLGKDYTVSISKTGYTSAGPKVAISGTGANSLAQNPYELYISGKITGTLNIADCGSVTVKAKDKDTSEDIKTAGGVDLSQSFSSGSTYSIDNILTEYGNSFQKGKTYTLTFTSTGSPGCETKNVDTAALVAGDNTLNVTLIQKVACTGANGSECLSGKVVNSQDTSLIVAGVNVSVNDQNGTARTAVTDSSGNFTIVGAFENNQAYTLSCSVEGYEDTTSCYSATFSVGNNLSKDLGSISLDPEGIYVKIDGVSYTFNHYTRQTYEKFLTEKWGHTFTSRNSNDLNIASSFYIHADDTSQLSLPNIVVSDKSGCSSYYHRHSNYVLIDGDVAKGALFESLNDSRACQSVIRGKTGGGADPGGGGVVSGGYEPSHSLLFHFYVSATDTIILQTEDSPGAYNAKNLDTKMRLLNSSGTEVVAWTSGGGTPATHAKISQSLTAGWYFVEVKGEATSNYGVFNLKVSSQAKNQTAISSTGTWSTNNLILSFYNHSNRTIYIAGENESGSSGSVVITSIGKYNEYMKGTFTGTLRAVNETGNTVTLTNGFFNIKRKE